MPKTQRESSLRYVHALFNVGTFGEQSDGELLELFLIARGEAAELAFAALVERHGAMVLRVCRVILRDEHEAWDAFQATFVVLVRRAGSLWVRDSLGPWLHQVARRVATCARKASARRRLHEGKAAEKAARAIPESSPDDLGPILHEEVDRLPAAYRSAVVACLLEGLTPEQASRRLGWPVGTVQSRLARGRERLKECLTRRGLAPSCGLGGLMIPGPASEAGIPVSLLESTLGIATRVATGGGAGMVPAAVEALARGACDMTVVSQAGKAALALLTFALVATGAAVVADPQSGLTRGQDGPAAAGVDEVVGREMARLDLEVLAEEVRLLRDQVESGLRRKHEAELSDPGSEAARSARASYEAARKAYLASSLQLRREEQRRGAIDPGLAETGPGIEGGLAVSPSEEGSGSVDRPSATGIGSINMAAVLERYEGAKSARARLEKETNAEKERLDRLREEFREIIARRDRTPRGTPESAKLESEILAAQARLEGRLSQAQRDVTRKEATVFSDLLKEIQGAVATVAKARGLTYVVAVNPRGSGELNPASVLHDFNQAVVYSDPRSDITEEVLGALNRGHAVDRLPRE